MITRADLGVMLFNEKVEQLLKERTEALQQKAAVEVWSEVYRRLAIVYYTWAFPDKELRYCTERVDAEAERMQKKK